MNIFNKPLKNVDLHDIEALIETKIEENLWLDYKRVLNLKDESSKNDLINDVAAFSNTDGGFLIYGIEEQGACPTVINGIEINNFDQLKRQLQSLLVSRVEPSITNCDFKQILVKDNYFILIIRIPKSWNSPHRVTYRDSDFYFRQSGKNALMDVYQIKNSFLSNAYLHEKIKVFIDDRIQSISQGNDPVNISKGPKIVLHIIPTNPFGRDEKIDILRFYNNHQYVPPLSHGGTFNNFINLDGLVTTNIKTIYSYMQFFRNGAIEACDLINNSSNKIPLKIGENIRIAVECYLKAYELLNITPPLYISIAMLDAKDYQLGLPDDAYEDEKREIKRNHIFFSILHENGIPETQKAPKILRPLFELFFNLFGIKDNLFYDRNGNWNQK
ncbi:MAG: ATP-binding protein [Proteobacteria bacterium]|nr:ATP-binding protein [Pseudomonadota bacterium]